MGGGSTGAVTAAGRRSASTGVSGLCAATAAGRPSASTGDSDVSAATAVVLLRARAAAGCVPRLRRVVGLQARALAGSQTDDPPQCRDCTNFVCQIQGCPRQDLSFAGAPSLLRHMRTKHGNNPRAVTKSKKLEVRQALRDAQITFEYQRRRPTPLRTLPCRLRGATSCWRLTRSSIRRLRHGRQVAWQRAQTAGAALQPGRLQDRRHDAADHQEGAPRRASTRKRGKLVGLLPQALLPILRRPPTSTSLARGSFTMS